MEIKGHVCGGHTWHAASLDEMHKVRRPEVNLFVFEREAPAVLNKAVFGPPSEDERLDCGTVDAAALSVLIAERFRCADDAARWLANDIVGLRTRFMAVVGTTNLHASLECVHAQGCTLLHVDHLPLRLITTYVGSGTVWIANGGVVRERLGTQNNVAVCPDTSFVRHAKRHAVLVMKGELYPGNTGRGLVHRSPEMAIGQTRLVLRIDVLP